MNAAPALDQKPEPRTDPAGRASGRASGRLLGFAAAFAAAVRFACSASVLFVILSAFAAVPILNLYVLGYLATVEGRIARGVRLRDAFPWLEYAPRMAAIAFGTGAALIPLAVVSDLAVDASLVDPASDQAVRLRVASRLLFAATWAHLTLAYLCGGTAASFCRPLKNFAAVRRAVRDGDLASTISGRLRDAAAALQFVRMTRRGVELFVMTFVWLLVPVGILASGGPMNGSRLLLDAAGILLLAGLFPILLVLQARYAREGSFGGAFALRAAMREWSQAPVAWLLAATVTVLLASPLILFKIVTPPRDAFWLVTPLFVLGVLPARMAAGGAMRRSQSRTRRPHALVVTAAAIASVPVALAYALTVFASQFVNEHGRWALFEQHAFGLPVPF